MNNGIVNQVIGVSGKTIAVDMDEVLARLNEKWVATYNTIFKDKLKPEDITSWDMREFVKEEAKPYVHGILDIEDFYRDLSIIADSQRVLGELAKNNKIIIVTNPYVRGSYLSKYDWLQEHFPFIPTEQYVFTGDKSIIKADFLIDDGTHNLEVFTGTPILFDAPHNRDEDGFFRVLNWQDVYYKLMYHVGDIANFYASKASTTTEQSTQQYVGQPQHMEPTVQYSEQPIEQPIQQQYVEPTIQPQYVEPTAQQQYVEQPYPPYTGQ